MTSKILQTLTPLASLQVSSKQIPAHNYIPNTSIQQKPLLIYHSAFPPDKANADVIERHLESIGVVMPQWRYSMFSTTHFHSTSHEVLCIASGAAICCFGGEENPERFEPELKKGDVVILPAGVGHRLLKETKSPFMMVGSYPPGKQWDMCYGRPDEKVQVDIIEQLAWFDKDPIYGASGPAMNLI